MILPPLRALVRCLVTALRSGCPPWATHLTRSLPLSSPFGPTFRLVYFAPAPALDCLSLWACAIARVFSAALRLPRSLPVDFATLHPSGCLRQSISLRSIISPFGLPCGRVGSHSSRNVSPFGLLCSLPRKPPLAWFPASARWHVFVRDLPSD